ncbi:helix-turn-helix domain-containing protein [Gluconacetobacter azotocaptans]|uniref:helix-turn-helix domain-containing protein n=1 Tax=Gluconacetobacter azotocaptans TaxID=142834 RepID=UPI00195C346C|nr:helix-turn-helix transcriptional regulator [Gluconacetobacter azotocaptans]
MDDLAFLLGGDAAQLERDYEEEAIQRLVNRARGLLAEAVSQDGVKPAELADRLNVNRSLVTRFFRSGQDMKVSTLALMARALGREWVLELTDRRDEQPGNAVSSQAIPIGWTTAPVPEVMPLVTVVPQWASCA